MLPEIPIRAIKIPVLMRMGYLVIKNGPVIAELNEKQRQAVLDENERALVLAEAESVETKIFIPKSQKTI